MLDTEVDRGLRSDIQDCLNSMLQTLAPDNLTHWLGLCKNVLSAAKSEDESKPEKGETAWVLASRNILIPRAFLLSTARSVSWGHSSNN